MPSAKRSLVNIATVVALATLISKVFGLVRQMAIAAAFGSGVAVDAYNFAYVVPSFLLILLGGVNGPFHSAIVSVIAKQDDKKQIQAIVETITTVVGIVLLVATGVLIVAAPTIIDLLATGLAKVDNGALIRTSAIQQFQIMSFVTLLAGFIGIGFGTLNAADMYWLPSVSPLLSSITVIAGVGIFYLQYGAKSAWPEFAIIGGQVLAWGTLSGAILQWLAQVIVQWRAGLGGFKFRFEWDRPEVKDVFKVLGPATLSSGMLQINLYTALWFASYIPKAPSALNYANLLVQTPLGIISSVILIPFFPVFARLTEPQQWPELKDRIRQGLLLTAITMFPLGAIMAVLALPISRVVYQRGAFSTGDSELVGQVLLVSSLGMFFYLARDIIVRVFYALGDGNTPFKISIINIFINGVLCWLCSSQYGAPGLTMATVGVNVFSFISLFWILNGRLQGFDWNEIATPMLKVFAAATIAGGATWGANYGWERFIQPRGTIGWASGLVLASIIGLVVFGTIASFLGLPEVEQVKSRLLSKFRRNRSS
jgi:putative peptidoglycan lipid II flippase